MNLSILKKYEPKIIIGFVILILAIAVIALIAFLTLVTPRVAHSAPDSDKTGISLTDKVEIEFNVPVSRTKVEPVISPNVEGSWEYGANILGSHLFKKLTFIPDGHYDPATQYNVSIKNISAVYGKKITSYDFTFTTLAVPKISSSAIADNSENVALDSAITLNLSEPNSGIVDYQFAFEPPIEFSVEQTSNSYVIRPKAALSAGTNYKLTAMRVYNISGITDKGEKDFEINFKTANPIAQATQSAPKPITVGVSATSPKNKASGVSVGSTISVLFNQAVNKAQAQNNFSVSPEISGGISWQGNKLIFSPNQELSKGTRYTISIGLGIDGSSGPTMSKNYSFYFTTEENSTLLNVKLDYQDKPLSCEAASLKMALSYKGVSVSEDDIMAIIGFDPTIRDGNIWGDPYSAFVGDINGHQDTTGYGVYWGPIAKAANSWRSAKAFSGYTASDLANEIASGNPVVIWGVAGKAPYQDDWQTPSGKAVHGWKGEHARVAIGFKGSADDPSSFIINDPIFGKLTWSTSQLISNWSTFGNSGVVVY